jgi:hypothetical protein
MKAKFLLTLFVISVLSFAKAQDTILVTPDKVLKAAIDPLQQIYYVNNQRQLVKLATTQDKTFLYTAIFLNKNIVLNVQNPFKVLLYKQDMGELITLDTRMTVTGSVNLFDLGYYDISALSSASNLQNVWLFDRARQQLILLDQQNKESFVTPIMSQLIGTSLSPVFVAEIEAKVYLVDPVKGIFIFDNLGNYFKQLPITGIQKIWVIGPKLYYFTEGQLWEYDLMLMESAPLITLKGFSEVQLCKDFILGLNSEGQLYKMNWPKAK